MSRSILQTERDYCLLCKMLHDVEYRGILEEHHVMYGPDRKKAEHYGLKVMLCLDHHRLGKEAVHNNKEISDILKEYAQIVFERKYGHEKWMGVFGKNYREVSQNE